MQSTSEITALLRLIDDPDDEVFDTVASKLFHYGREIIPNLEQLWEVTTDESIQERIELLIHRVHFHDLQQDFLEWSKARHPNCWRRNTGCPLPVSRAECSIYTYAVRPGTAQHLARAQQLSHPAGAGKRVQQYHLQFLQAYRPRAHRPRPKILFYEPGAGE